MGAVDSDTGRRRSSGEHSRSRRRELQAALGELGVVCEYSWHGSPDRPARGWYAELVGGELVFLGDHTPLAFMRIGELVR